VRHLRIDALRWLPALAATAYVSTVLVRFTDLVGSRYWDSDAASSFVLGERLRGHGPVYIPHFGFWTSLWWLLATRHLPGHRQLWEGTGYAFVPAGAGLLAWATARVAGRWAGVTAGATALVVGPFALQSLLTVNTHVSTPFTAALLAAYLVLLTQQRSVFLTVVVGLIAGANAASDPLLWIAGVAPFALAAAVLAAGTRERNLVAHAGATLLLVVASAVTTDLVMRALGYHIVGTDLRPAHLADLPSNVVNLGRAIALVGGANYSLPGGYPQEPFRIVLATLVFAGLAALLFSTLRASRRHIDPVIRAFSWFWSAAVILLGAAFVLTAQAAAQGAGSANYLLTFSLAAGAGVALFATRSTRRRVAIAVAVAVVGAINITSVAQGRGSPSPGAIGTYQQELTRLLQDKEIRRGYAGFWDAASLTWQSRMRLVVSPVTPCGQELCGHRFFTIASWFRERPGPSFLIVDPMSGVSAAPPVTRTAIGSYRFGPLRVYVFDYDLARHIRPPSA
jgi:hypothetical protein